MDLTARTAAFPFAVFFCECGMSRPSEPGYCQAVRPALLCTSIRGGYQRIPARMDVQSRAGLTTWEYPGSDGLDIPHSQKNTAKGNAAVRAVRSTAAAPA